MVNGKVEWETRVRLESLTRGEVSRGDIADWATRMMDCDDPEVDEPKIWSALDLLSGVDLKSGPNEYLHSVQDLKEWLENFLSEGG